MKCLASWLADREIWPTIAGVALATFTCRWAPWGLGLLALAWLARWLGRGRLTVRTPVDAPACLLLLTMPLSFWATADRGATFVAVSRLLAGLALAYGLANWARTQGQLSLLALGLAALGLGLALYSLVSVPAPSPGKAPYVQGYVFEQAPVQVEDTVNANIMAGALVVLFPYPLAMALVSGALPPLANARRSLAAGRIVDRPWLWRTWFALAALAVAALLLLLKSRGAWFAAGAAIVVLLARRWRRALWSIPVALLLGAGLALWWVGPPAFFDALAPGGDSLEQWTSRVEIWSRAIYTIQDFPYTGAGAGTFGHVTDTLYPFFTHGPEAGVPHAHNLLLQVAVDLGIPGLVAYLALLLLALWMAADGAHRHRQAGEGALAVLSWASVASLVAMLVHGMVDATTWIVGRGAFVPWATIGTILAVHRASCILHHDRPVARRR